jgi:hypothetical protein
VRCSTYYSVSIDSVAILYRVVLDLLTAILALEDLAVKGEAIRCADGKTRYCYPILNGIIADY